MKKQVDEIAKQGMKLAKHRRVKKKSITKKNRNKISKWKRWNLPFAARLKVTMDNFEGRSDLDLQIISISDLKIYQKWLG